MTFTSAAATSYAGTAFSAVPSSKIGLTIADGSSPALIPGFYGGNGSTAYSLVSGNNPGSWYDFAEVATALASGLCGVRSFKLLHLVPLKLAAVALTRAR